MEALSPNSRYNKLILKEGILVANPFGGLLVDRFVLGEVLVTISYNLRSKRINVEIPGRYIAPGEHRTIYSDGTTTRSDIAFINPLTESKAEKLERKVIEAIGRRDIDVRVWAREL